MDCWTLDLHANPWKKLVLGVCPSALFGYRIVGQELITYFDEVLCEHIKQSIRNTLYEQTTIQTMWMIESTLSVKDFRRLHETSKEIRKAVEVKHAEFHPNI
ncbi:hypothetical protein AXF42_Ash018102 [Apostasia shenzhenica]|uniref:Uncharacterized protein n=1 Tax=Apostasia shenzhenica TaxID=1088818 RepID=A0A2I0AVR4_9ASPA|nr:hypothetical protein AXF42_Ash018102 [Apostasia shenzhenica]